MGLRRLQLIGRGLLVSWAAVIALLPFLVLSDLPRAIRVTVVVGDLFFAALWAVFFAWILGRDRPRLTLASIVIAEAAAVVVVALVAPHQQLAVGGMQAVPIVFSGAAFGWRLSLPLAAGLSLATLAIDLLQHLPPGVAVIDLVENLSAGLGAIVVRQLIVGYLQLHEAREQIERLAVAEERLRFARDVHDLLGQSLATIVLKSEVVARRLPPEAEPGLRDEVGEVVRVGRRALDELREAVAGYRQPSLDVELSDARQALRAARIEATVERAAGRLRPTEEAVLGWAVREAVTNVIRHSGARRCRISLSRAEDGRLRLEVADDGRGPGGPVQAGNGLRGIRERALAAGGEGLAEAGGRGFRLLVTLPGRPRLETAPAAEPEAVSG